LCLLNHFYKQEMYTTVYFFFYVLYLGSLNAVNSSNIDKQSVDKTIIECSEDYGRANPYDGSGGGGFVEGCHPVRCNRLVFNKFLDSEGVDRLKAIAERAIEVGRGDGGRPGPTILDINSGYLRDDQGLVNIYEKAGEGGGGVFDKVRRRRSGGLERSDSICLSEIFSSLLRSSPSRIPPINIIKNSACRFAPRPVLISGRL